MCVCVCVRESECVCVCSFTLKGFILARRFENCTAIFQVKRTSFINDCFLNLNITFKCATCKMKEYIHR